MKIKNAFYSKSMPTQIIVEMNNGKFYRTNLSPFREVKEDEIHPLACFAPIMGEEIPDYTLRFYGLEKKEEV
jgi:hypothetical protein